MNVDLGRRQLRRELGTRTGRRENTKTTVNLSRPKPGGKKGPHGGPSKQNKLTYPRRQRPRPSVLLKARIRQILRTAAN